jgi:hypothetical protein
MFWLMSLELSRDQASDIAPFLDRRPRHAGTGRPSHMTDAASPTTNTPGTFSRAGASGKPGAVEPERCSRSRNIFEQAYQAYVLAIR